MKNRFAARLLVPFLILAPILMASRFLQTPDLTDLTAVLTWLATGAGASVVVMYALSLVAENIPAWHNLPSWVKFVVPMVAALLVSGGATLLLASPETVATLTPWFKIVVGAVLGWIASQAAYLRTKATTYGIGKDQ